MKVGLALRFWDKFEVAVIALDLGTGGILFVILAAIGAFFFAIRQLAGLSRVLGLMKLRVRSFKRLS